MKKTFIFLLLVCSMFSSFSQGKIAVLDFTAGVGISQSDVDGLSSTFVTYFNPRGYILVERTQINQVIAEQNFQRTCLTEQQMVRLGQILNLTKIVIGDVNIVAGSPNLDVRVVDVQSGNITGRDGSTFSWSNFRPTVKTLAERIAGQIGIVEGSVPAPSKPTSSDNVQTIFGYLHVYPSNLGEFTGMPSNVISALNRQGSYGYNDWRLPTSEELDLMMAQCPSLRSAGGKYMTIENSGWGEKMQVRLVTTGKSVAEMSALCPSMTDNDGNTYKTILLGEQCWTAENLRTTKNRNGSDIPLGSSTSSSTSYRYYPNGSSGNVATYGYLYNWTAAQSVCPSGWHLPSDAEWTQLTSFLINQKIYSCGSDGDIAKALASTTGWNSSSYKCDVGNNPSSNNAAGFSAVPAGNYGYYGCYNFGDYAYFWSATEYVSSDAYRRNLYYRNANVDRYNESKDAGFSVRCVRN